MKSKPDLLLRQATAEDINALLSLLNQSYRENLGWTNEAHLVSGIRTTAAEIKSMIDNPQHYLFVFPQIISNTETGKILGCISVEIKAGNSSENGLNDQYSTQPIAYIGTFAVDPTLQGQGIGNDILSAAETFAKRHLKGLIKQSHQLTSHPTSARLDYPVADSVAVDAVTVDEGMLHDYQMQNRSAPKQNSENVLLKMSVLEQRPELLGYYERRGYALNGNSHPFPEDSNNGEPLMANLKLLELEKWVQ